jgi:hypothetical protein
MPASSSPGRSWVAHFREEGAKVIPPPTDDDPYEDESYRLWAIKQR